MRGVEGIKKLRNRNFGLVWKEKKKKRKSRVFCLGLLVENKKITFGVYKVNDGGMGASEDGQW